MKFIAYLLIAANIGLAIFYISTKEQTVSNVAQSKTATLSNLSYQLGNSESSSQEKAVTQEASNKQEQAKSTTTNTTPDPKPESKPEIVATSKPVEQNVCIEISQIDDATTAQAISSFLNSKNIDHSQREENKIIKTDYWILIGPFSSTNRTKLEVKNLKDNNIDYYVLASGEFKGAISLGLYSNKSNAEGEIKRINAKGFNARIENKDIYKSLFFFDIPSSSSQKLTNETWNSLLSNFSAIKKSKKSC